MDGPLGNCHSQNCSMTRENKRYKKDWFSPSPPPQALQIPSHLSETASSSPSLFVVVLFLFFFKKKSSAFEEVHQFLRCTWFHSTKELQLSPLDLLTGALGKDLAHGIPRAHGRKRCASRGLSLHFSSWRSPTAPEVPGPSCSSLVQEET